MGNCFKSSSNDDVSLIRGNDRPNARHEPASVRNVPPAPTRNIPPASTRNTPQDSNGAQPESQSWMPVYHPSPGVSRPANQLTEEEQVRIAQRIGLIGHLPVGKYDGTNKHAKECVICMNEFMLDEQLRYLPCLHIYHKDCIDDWLMRSFTCPSCLEPVDAALLTSYQTG
ncbi:hypothetical protein BsWGS_19900 [Bradybaena similaris]